MDNIYQSSYTGEQIDEAVRRILNGGSGECSGSHIIEVSELPAEGIEGTLYKCGDTFYQWETRKILKDIIVSEIPGFSFVNLVETNEEGSLLFPDLTLHYAQEIPAQSSIKESFIHHNVHLYYIERENDVFAYMRPMVDGSDGDGNFFPVVSEWRTLGAIMTDLDALLGLTFQGCLIADSGESITLNTGYYALISTEKVWKPYSYPCVIDVDALPTENIDMNAIYRVIEKKFVGTRFYYPEENMWLTLDMYGLLCTAFAETPTVIHNISSLEELPDEPDTRYNAVYYCREGNTIHVVEDSEWICVEDGVVNEDGTVARFILEDDPAYYRPQEEKLIGLVMKDTTIGACEWIKEGAQVAFVGSSAKIIINFHTLPTTPETTDGALVSSDSVYHIYYFTDTRMIGTCHNDDETGDVIFTPWSPGKFSYGSQYNGIISDAGDAREDGYHALVQPAWEKCIRPSGTTIALDNNCTIDTREYNSVHVKIAEYEGVVRYG